MNGLLETFLGQGVLGQAVKHFVPWDGINKAIPIINAVGGAAYMKSQGMDWGSAIIGGVIGSLGAGKAKDEIKGNVNFLQDRKFKGIGIREKRVTLVDRSF